MTIQIIKTEMKQIISCMFFIGAFLAVVGCDTSDNFGYPSKITLPHEGGEKIITGEEVLFYNIEVADYNGDGNSVSINPDISNDSLVVSYDWLTVKTKIMDSKITLVAQPNKTRKRRKLYVMGSYNNDLIEIKVEQP